MSIQSIEEFKAEVERLLAVLARNIDDDYYPRNVRGTILNFEKWLLVTFDYPKGDATPFIELWNGQFYFVINERGNEYQRVAGSANEILALLFYGITSSLACNYEMRHRVKGQDSRRVAFSKQIELLAILDADWAHSVSEKHHEVLERHPFRDNP